MATKVVHEKYPELGIGVVLSEQDGRSMVQFGSRVIVFPSTELKLKIPKKRQPKNVIAWITRVPDVVSWLRGVVVYIYVEVPHDRAMAGFESAFLHRTGSILELNNEAVHRHDSPDWWWYSLRMLVPHQDGIKFPDEFKVQYGTSQDRISNNDFIWELLSAGWVLGNNKSQNDSSNTGEENESDNSTRVEEVNPSVAA